jgi:hypothetical protein
MCAMNEKYCAAGRWLVRSLALAVLVMAAGCTASGNITGKVRYKGKPLPAGLVSFIPQSGSGHPVDGQIAEDGTYSISRVPVGPVKIVVKSVEPPKGPPARTGPGGMAAHMGPPTGAALPPGVKPPNFDPSAEADKYVKLPAKYSDPEQTDLTYTVTSGTQTKDIDME